MINNEQMLADLPKTVIICIREKLSVSETAMAEKIATRQISPIPSKKPLCIFAGLEDLQVITSRRESWPARLIPRNAKVPKICLAITEKPGEQNEKAMTRVKKSEGFCVTCEGNNSPLGDDV